eukprot:2498281-Prymnesium_polylepis.1
MPAVVGAACLLFVEASVARVAQLAVATADTDARAAAAACTLARAEYEAVRLGADRLALGVDVARGYGAEELGWLQRAGFVTNNRDCPEGSLCKIL